jgi:diacylglycerol O-acyltransferase
LAPAGDLLATCGAVDESGTLDPGGFHFRPAPLSAAAIACPDGKRITCDRGSCTVNPMQVLDGLDSAFLYLETPNSPMHIGSVQIYEGRGDSFSFERYRSLVQSRLHVSSVFRRRAVHVPLNLGRPYWVEDPRFDLDAHLEHISLPRPGTWRQLRDLAEERFATPLDPNRPLWSLTFVEGLEGLPELPDGSFALISRVHHAAADGMGSIDLFSALWDVSPEGRVITSPRKWQPEPLPSGLGLLGRSVANLALQPTNIVRTATAVVRGGWGLGREVLTGEHHGQRLLFAAPKTRFNEPIVVQRSFGGVSFPLDGVKDIKNRMPGTTVNDVVLAICAGALRKYLEATDELPDDPLIAMAPISVREEVDAGLNRVSAMLVDLATHEDDTLRRFAAIRESTRESKAYVKAIGAGTLTDSTRIVPFSLASGAARLYSRMKIAHYHRPPFNLVITNVPGPRTQLYLGGARLLNVFGMAPVIDGLGLIMVITSFADHLTISVNAARNLLPDVDNLLANLRSSYRELNRAVPAVSRGRTRRKGRPAARRSGKKG